MYKYLRDISSSDFFDITLNRIASIFLLSENYLWKMDSRNIKGGKAVMLIETSLCKPLFLTLFFLGMVVVTVVWSLFILLFLLFILLILLIFKIGCVLSILIPDEYITDSFQALKCNNEGSANGTAVCSEDFFKEPFYPAYYACNSTGLRNNKRLFLRPHSSYSSIGINFDYKFRLQITKNGRPERFSDIDARFFCRPGGFCNDHLILNYDKEKLDVTVNVGDELVAEEVQNYLGGLDFVTRYDNMKFEVGTVWFAFMLIYMYIYHY